LPYVKLEGFMVGVSVLVVSGVGMYVFYAFFSGRMASIPALVLLLVAAVAFGFFVVVASYLGEQRAAGNIYEHQRSWWEGARTSPQRSGVIADVRWTRLGQKRYSYGLALLALVGIPIILWAPVIGIVLTVMASISLAVVRAAQIFGEETIEGQ